MKALLLAAGYGTRLQPITLKTPKCMVQIEGRPLLSYWLELFKDDNIEKIIINTHYLPEKVFDFCKNSPHSHKISISYEEELLGTAGTILANKDLLGDEAFMVAHADNLTKFDLNAFLVAHRNRPKGAEITMMVFKTDVPESCGIVELDSMGILRRMHEKVENPPGNLANAAVYIMERSVLEFIEKIGRKKVDLSTEVIPYFINKIYTYHNQIYHRDIGSLSSLRKANEDFRNLNFT